MQKTKNKSLKKLFHKNKNKTELQYERTRFSKSLAWNDSRRVDMPLKSITQLINWSKINLNVDFLFLQLKYPIEADNWGR